LKKKRGTNDENKCPKFFESKGSRKEHVASRYNEPIKKLE